MTRNWNSTSTARFSEITERCADRSTPLFMLFDVSCGLDVEVRGGNSAINFAVFLFKSLDIFSYEKLQIYGIFK